MYIVEPTVKTSEGMAVVPPSWPSGTRPTARPPPTQPSTVRAAGSAFEERSPAGEGVPADQQHRAVRAAHRNPEVGPGGAEAAGLGGAGEVADLGAGGPCS